MTQYIGTQFILDINEKKIVIKDTIAFNPLIYIVYMHRHNKYPFPTDEHFRIFPPLTIMGKAAMTSVCRSYGVNAPLFSEVALVTDRMSVCTAREENIPKQPSNSALHQLPLVF